MSITPSSNTNGHAHDINTPISFGDHIYLQSNFNKFLCVNNFGQLVCNREVARDWEQFVIVQAGNDPAALGQPVRYNDLIHLRSRNNKYICATDAGKARCLHREASAWETFIIVSPMTTLPDDDQDFDSIIYNSSRVAFHSTSHLTYLTPSKSGKIRANSKGPPGPDQCFKLKIAKKWTTNGLVSPVSTPINNQDPFAGVKIIEEPVQDESEDEEENGYASPLANFPSFSYATSTNAVKRQIRSGMLTNYQRNTKRAAQMLMIDQMSAFPNSQLKIKYVRDLCEQNTRASQSKRVLFTGAEVVAILDTFSIMTYRMEALRLLCARSELIRHVTYFTAGELVAIIKPYTMSHFDRYNALKMCCLGYNNPSSNETLEILDMFQSQNQRLDVIKLLCKIEPEDEESYIVNDTTNFKRIVLECEEVFSILDRFDSRTHKQQVVNYIAQSKRFMLSKVEIEMIVKELTRSPEWKTQE